MVACQVAQHPPWEAWYPEYPQPILQKKKKDPAGTIFYSVLFGSHTRARYTSAQEGVEPEGSLPSTQAHTFPEATNNS